MGAQTDSQGLINDRIITLLSKFLARYISLTLLNLPKLQFSGAALYDEALSSLFRLQIWRLLSRVSSYFAWRTNSSEIRGAGTRRIIMQCLPWELILCFTVCCVYNKRAFRTKEREWEPAWARCFPLKPWVTFIVERRLGGGGKKRRKDEREKQDDGWDVGRPVNNRRLSEWEKNQWRDRSQKQKGIMMWRKKILKQIRRAKQKNGREKEGKDSSKISEGKE